MRGLSVVHFSSGEVIFRHGDPSEALYFMLGPTTDPEADDHDDEYVLLTTEANEKGDEPEGGGGDGLKRELPFMPSQRFFGEEGLLYRCVCRWNAQAACSGPLRWTGVAKNNRSAVVMYPVLACFLISSL